ncbi:hypothetical protein [Terriglobus sp.]|uniref:hypothetical protein n=1 Tax=Terriglobus sp. TaxID=1889013 RepID=UPI003AFFF7F8
MSRTGHGWRLARAVVAALALWTMGALQGCKTHDDAVAAAEQMAETAATMQRYFATLDTLIVKNEEAQRAQSYLLRVDFDAAALGQMEDTRAEIGKRARLAAEVARISAAFAEITSSQADHEAATAAGALKSELTTLKLGASSDAAAKALLAAVTSLVNAVRAHDEVKAAKLLEPVMAALCDFYDSEKPLYVSVADGYYAAAASNAKELIRRDQVATNERYRSSLEPFGLQPDVHAPELLKAVHEDLKQQVEQRLLQHKRDDADAADALGEALHRMRERVDAVAKGRALRVRMPPLTLAGVKAWVAEVQMETGVSL